LGEILEHRCIGWCVVEPIEETQEAQVKPAVQVEGVGALVSPLPKEHVKLQEFKS